MQLRKREVELVQQVSPGYTKVETFLGKINDIFGNALGFSCLACGRGAPAYHIKPPPTPSTSILALGGQDPPPVPRFWSWGVKTPPLSISILALGGQEPPQIKLTILGIP